MNYSEYIEYQKEQEKEYNRLEKKLFSMNKKVEKDLNDLKIEEMTIIQLRERLDVLKQDLLKRYSKSGYVEYKKICKILKERSIESKMDFIDEQLEKETYICLYLFLDTLEHKEHVYDDFEEPYLFLKITLIKKLIKSLEKEMEQNQDMVNEIIKYIKMCSRES